MFMFYKVVSSLPFHFSEPSSRSLSPSFFSTVKSFFSRKHCRVGCFQPVYYDFDSVILPLFQYYPIKAHSISLSSAISKIQSWVLFYYDSHNDSFSSNTRNELSLYFHNLKNFNLYSTPYKDQLHPIIIQLSTLLPPFDDLQSTSALTDILDPLIYSITNRLCLDQHRSQLQSILGSHSFKQFDAPIRDILSLMYDRMFHIIHSTLSDWESNLLKGFVNYQRIHTEHLTFILLDELFNIAGGHLKSEKDLVLDKFYLTKEILWASFKDTLTLKNIFSESDVDDWKVYLAKQLSIGGDDRPFDCKLPLSSLLNAPHFLSYLFRHQHLDSIDYNTLKRINDTSTLETLTFSLPWVFYTDDVDNPETRYNTLFVTILMQYIHESLTGNLIPTVFSKPKSPFFSTKDVRSSHRSQLVNQYFTHIQKREPFSYNDIKFALYSFRYRKGYTHSFLFHNLHVGRLMFIHCNPKDAKILFNQFILHRQDFFIPYQTLSMMTHRNPEAIKAIGTKRVLSFIMDRGEYFFSSSNELIPEICETIFTLTSLNPSLIYELGNWKDHSGNSFLHLLSCLSPTVFERFVESFPAQMNFFSIRTNSEKNSFWHILAFNNPKSFYRLLSKQLIPVDRLSSFLLYKLDNPIFHSLCAVNLSVFLEFNDKNHDFLLQIKSLRTHSGSTLFHWLAFYDPDIFLTLLETKNSNACSIISSSHDERGHTAFNVLAEVHPSYLCYLIKENLLPLDVISQQTFEGGTLLHWLARSHVSYFVHLLNSTYPLLVVPSKIKDFDGYSSLDLSMLVNPDHVKLNLCRDFLDMFNTSKFLS